MVNQQENSGKEQQQEADKRGEVLGIAEQSVQAAQRDMGDLKEATIFNFPGRLKDKLFKAVETQTKAKEEWMKSSLEANPIKGIGRKLNSLKLSIQGAWKENSAFGGAVIDTFKGTPQPVQSIF